MMHRNVAHYSDVISYSHLYTWIVIIKRFWSILEIMLFSNGECRWGFNLKKLMLLDKVIQSIYTVCLPYLGTRDLMNFSAISIFLSSEMWIPTT